MNALLELTIERKKLVIKQLREVKPTDLVAVRETLNSIDFIMGDDDLWDYKTDSTGCRATTKVRFYESETILKFIEDNKDKLKIDSIDTVFITDLTKVYKIDRSGKSKQDIIQRYNLDETMAGNKNRIIKKINESIESINELAETMGGIL